jgi:hypothetical protein
MPFNPVTTIADQNAFDWCPGLFLDHLFNFLVFLAGFIPVPDVFGMLVRGPLVGGHLAQSHAPVIIDAPKGHRCLFFDSA